MRFAIGTVLDVLTGRRGAAAGREIAGGDPAPRTAAAPAGAVIAPDWFVLWPELAKGMEDQLAREILPGHKLEGRLLTAALKSQDSDDVVYFEETEGGPAWWMVHLSWAVSVDSRWPAAGRIEPPTPGKPWP